MKCVGSARARLCQIPHYFFFFCPPHHLGRWSMWSETEVLTPVKQKKSPKKQASITLSLKNKNNNSSLPVGRHCLKIAPERRTLLSGEEEEKIIFCLCSSNCTPPLFYQPWGSWLLSNFKILTTQPWWYPLPPPMWSSGREKDSSDTSRNHVPLRGSLGNLSLPQEYFLLTAGSQPLYKQGTNKCDAFERWGPVKFPPPAAESGAISSCVTLRNTIRRALHL